MRSDSVRGGGGRDDSMLVSVMGGSVKSECEG